MNHHVISINYRVISPFSAFSPFTAALRSRDHVVHFLVQHAYLAASAHVRGQSHPSLQRMPASKQESYDMHRLRGPPRRLTVEETRTVLTKRDAAARLEGLAATTNMSLFQVRVWGETDRHQCARLVFKFSMGASSDLSGHTYVCDAPSPCVSWYSTKPTVCFNHFIHTPLWMCSINVVFIRDQ